MGQLVILASVRKAFTVSPPLCAHNLEGRWKINKSLQTTVNIMKAKYMEPREHKIGRLTWSDPEHLGSWDSPGRDLAAIGIIRSSDSEARLLGLNLSPGIYQLYHLG